MKKYIGTNQVKATPAIRKGGKIYLPTDVIPRTMEPVEEGYKVIYEDGHGNWLPKDVFEKVYKLADTFLDRLIIEQKELAGKLEELCLFVDSHEFKETVKDENQRRLLLVQREHMGEYLNILNQRVNLLKG